ncbi:MAG: NUMOD4 domain-containing protein [Sphaerochaetaceae bacterium]|jgi:hypothetical protein
MCEIWKDIVDFEGLYQVSSLGNVRRHPDKQCKNKYVTPKPLPRAVSRNRFGYLYATLSKDGRASKKTVHQLVAVAFFPNAAYGCVVNHLDGNKLNNAKTNLEITTHQGNNLHAHKNGLTPKPGKSVYHNVHIVTSRYKDKTYTYYAAKVKDNYKILINKQFTCEIEAAKAVDAFLDSIGDTQRQRNFP